MLEECAALINELTELRKAKGWTQAELAQSCGLTQSVIARLENKKSTPTIETLQKIALALGASLSLNLPESRKNRQK